MHFFSTFFKNLLRRRSRQKKNGVQKKKQEINIPPLNEIIVKWYRISAIGAQIYVNICLEMDTEKQKLFDTEMKQKLQESTDAKMVEEIKRYYGPFSSIHQEQDFDESVLAIEWEHSVNWTPETLEPLLGIISLAKNRLAVSVREFKHMSLISWDQLVTFLNNYPFGIEYFGFQRRLVTRHLLGGLMVTKLCTFLHRQLQNHGQRAVWDISSRTDQETYMQLRLSSLLHPEVFGAKTTVLPTERFLGGFEINSEETIHRNLAKVNRGNIQIHSDTATEIYQLIKEVERMLVGSKNKQIVVWFDPHSPAPSLDFSAMIQRFIQEWKRNERSIEYICIICHQSYVSLDLLRRMALEESFDQYKRKLLPGRTQEFSYIFKTIESSLLFSFKNEACYKRREMIRIKLMQEVLHGPFLDRPVRFGSHDFA